MAEYTTVARMVRVQFQPAALYNEEQGTITRRKNKMRQEERKDSEDLAQQSAGRVHCICTYEYGTAIC